MKKFLIKILIILTIIAAIVLIVNEIYIRNVSWHTDDIYAYESMPSELQICNFGSSHGVYGYNYENYEEKYNCFNFGLVSQSLSYDYRLFQNYENHIGKGAVVFITISYFSLFGKDETLEDDFESKNKRYYSILPPSLIKKYDFTTDLYTYKLPILGIDPEVMWGKMVRSVLRIEEPQEVVDEDIVSTENVDLHEDAKKACGRHVDNAGKHDENGNFIVNQEEVQALYDLIHMCKNKGAIPILIITPYLREYTDEVKKVDGFYEQFYELLSEIAEKESVEYYDYAFDERFNARYEWFMNSDHLNETGAKEFVDILMKEIVFKKGYL
ncbi:MAG: hypothetical protein MJ133_01540 [Lachnospiraceae bacterium]|nr:hypothetical protein [Lachnospiraceae bacterium]